jgi:phage-related minor tail protein
LRFAQFENFDRVLNAVVTSPQSYARLKRRTGKNPIPFICSPLIFLTRDADEEFKGVLDERFLGEVGIDMDLAVNEAINAFSDEEIVTPQAIAAAKDSQTLKNEQLRLQIELREMMLSGNAAGVMRVRNLLNNLPDAIIAAEIAELRQSIDATNARLTEIKADTEYAEQIKGEKNKVLAEHIKTVEEAGLAVERVNFILFQLDTEAENLREVRREYRQRLNKFIEEVQL